MGEYVLDGVSLEALPAVVYRSRDRVYVLYRGVAVIVPIL